LRCTAVLTKKNAVFDGCPTAMTRMLHSIPNYSRLSAGARRTGSVRRGHGFNCNTHSPASDGVLFVAKLYPDQREFTTLTLRLDCNEVLIFLGAYFQLDGISGAVFIASDLFRVLS
jgi:hypothetical protein